MRLLIILPHFLLFKLFYLTSTVVTLGFNDTFYEVKEGESIEICLTEVTAELEKDIVITVESSGGTATCK